MIDETVISGHKASGSYHQLPITYLRVQAWQARQAFNYCSRLLTLCNVSLCRAKQTHGIIGSYFNNRRYSKFRLKTTCRNRSHRDAAMRIKLQFHHFLMLLQYHHPFRYSPYSKATWFLSGWRWSRRQYASAQHGLLRGSWRGRLGGWLERAPSPKGK